MSATLGSEPLPRHEFETFIEREYDPAMQRIGERLNNHDHSLDRLEALADKAEGAATALERLISRWYVRASLAAVILAALISPVLNHLWR